MKELTKYQKNGYRFTLHCRSGNIAIFHGKLGGAGAPSWEVIHIQSHNGLVIGGKEVEPAEFAPSNEEWGSKGWSYQTEGGARNRFEIEVGKAASNE